MTFIQVIDCKTSRFDEMNRLMDIWVEQTRGKRTATHSLLGKDRSNASHFIEIVEFPSYEEAMRNSTLPETDRIFREMVALCEEMPTFTDLDVVRDEQMCMLTVRRFFLAVSAADGPPPLDDLVAERFHGHDPADEQDVLGPDGVRRAMRAWRAAFDFEFSVEDLIAQGDRVCARWFWKGVHRGDFLGVPATGGQATMTGTTVFRCGGDGLIAEAWWEYDRLGLLRQLGAFGEAGR